jgi:hypothetical protein
MDGRRNIRKYFIAQKGEILNFYLSVKQQEFRERFCLRLKRRQKQK